VSGADRLSVTGAPYDDFVRVVRPVVERFPERTLWGTDWSHPNIPDDVDLVDIIPRLAPSLALQEALLVTNPTRIYWSK